MTNKEKELLRLMIRGAEQICDQSLDLWTADVYHLGEKTRQAYLKEWKEKKAGIRNLANKIKEIL